MAKFFLVGIIVLVFCTLFLIQNSFTSLIPPTNNTTLVDPHLQPKDNSEDNNKITTVNTTKNQLQKTEETASPQISNTNTAERKHNEYSPEQNSKDINNKQQASKEGKEFPQQPPEKPEKDILQDIKSPHGEVVVKKIKTGKSVTILTTEDKRITGLQMQKNQTTATGELYIDNKNSKAETGIQVPNNKQQPVSTKSYIPDHRADPRY